ncbi:MAG: inositol monophosphatase [Candidatus Omnitrophica bacterium]|nr:inositol monophosphatase [Candidatus Omnitrophota bacterium]
MSRIKKLAVEAAEEAGRYALLHMEKISKIARKKGYNDLVTDVDRHCERIIIKRIKKDFPDHSILAEESGGDTGDGGFCWIIDPVDGTTNYVHGFPFFCTSIGVMFEGAISAGVVYDPSRRELFSAEKNKGAFLNRNRINVSGMARVRDSLIATGFAYKASGRTRGLTYFNRVLRHAQAIRRAGSAALDLCYAACGRFDGFWEFGLNPWDTAAGRLIVEEAGGTVTTLDGGPFDVFQKEIVASNGKIHKELLHLLNC